MQPFLSLEQLPDLPWSLSVDSPEHLRKELIVVEPVSLKKLHDGQVRRDEIVVKMCDPHPQNMLRERNADLLVKHPAEIFPAEPELVRQLLKSDGLGVVHLDVVKNLLDPLPLSALLFHIVREERDGKMLHKQVENLKDNGLRLQPESFLLIYIMRDELLEELAHLEIRLELLLGQLIPAAPELYTCLPFDPHGSRVSDEEFPVHKDADLHEGLGAAQLVHPVRVDRYELPLNKREQVSVQNDIRAPIQKVDQLQLPLKMGSVILPVVREIVHTDAGIL